MAMRRSQALLVMLAMLGAAGAIFPWSDRYRLASAVLAFLIISYVGVVRVRAHGRELSRDSEAEGTMALVARIRDQRAKRFNR
jgi:hypothetical protein